MGMPNLVCFDWDGTLLDTNDHITNACIAAGQELGLPPVSLEQVHAMTGVQIDVFFNQIFGVDVDAETVLPVYHKHYYKQAPAKTFEGATALLEFLKQQSIAIAIVTNKSRQALEIEMRATGIEKLVDSIWVAEEYAPKPSPIMIRAAQSAHQASPEMTWMVGDALPDLYASDRAGCGRMFIVRDVVIPAWMEHAEYIGSLSALLEVFRRQQVS